MPDEFSPAPTHGRVVSIQCRVGLGAIRPDGRLRLDALAQYLQDVADEDSSTAPIGNGGVWVLRRVEVWIARTPRARDELTCSTWCSGMGARWAERRTDLTIGGEPRVQAVAIWVHVDPRSGAPLALPAGFADVWGATAGDRRPSARLRLPPPPPDATTTSWPLRATDLDPLGHVNNAAYWAPVEEELATRGRPQVRRAEIEFRGGIDADEPVEWRVAEHESGFAGWLCVAGDVRASALVGCQP